MDDWDHGKGEHLRLSEAAAAKYDAMYETSNFATGSYMSYELEVVAHAATLAPAHDIAIDLGCGTGRDSFVLSRHFAQVFGFDFSPAMIREATANKLSRACGNVAFQVADVEDGLPMVPDGSANLVNASFGMGSFARVLVDLFRTYRRILTPNGIGVFSFYNEAALVNRLNLSWRPALAARTVPGKDVLSVDFAGDIHELAARSYRVPELRELLSSNFTLEEIVTFPTLTALFPQELFDSPEAQSLCVQVDRLLAANLDVAAGPYIIAIVRVPGKKAKKAGSSGYARVLELFETHKIDPDNRLRHHDRVRNMDDVRKVLPEAAADTLVKSILVSVRPPSGSSDQRERLFLFGIPADRQLDFGKVHSLLDVPRSRVSMARMETVERVTGFKVGAIPPFALPKSIPVILDHSLEEQKTIWCGTGKSTESIRLTTAELAQLATPSYGDITRLPRTSS